jgi:hypothetical protein
MACRRSFFIIKSLVALFAVMNVLIGCNQQHKKATQEAKSSDIHYFKDFFGEKYLAMGSFSSISNDSIENKLWYYTNLDRPLVVYGTFFNGMPAEDWKFVLNDGTLMSSKWTTYSNGLTSCAFSVPFSFEETIVDSNYFKLATMNDSLGKVSIIVGVRDIFMKEEDLAKFGPHSEIGLTQQGYTFRSNRREIKKGVARYFFTEYFMKDSVNKDVKLYNVYGYCPSKRHFIEFALFHNGPKEDLVKIIFNLIVSSLYVENERFFNPYIN